jgi:hypothetical protein
MPGYSSIMQCDCTIDGISYFVNKINRRSTESRPETGQACNHIFWGYGNDSTKAPDFMSGIFPGHGN